MFLIFSNILTLSKIGQIFFSIYLFLKQFYAAIRFFKFILPNFFRKRLLILSFLFFINKTCLISNFSVQCKFYYRPSFLSSLFFVISTNVLSIFPSFIFGFIILQQCTVKIYKFSFKHFRVILVIHTFLTLYNKNISKIVDSYLIRNYKYTIFNEIQKSWI